MRYCIWLSIAVLCWHCQSNDKPLVIWGERETIEREENGQKIIDTLYHTIPDFKFVNQYGDTITQEFVKGKIYVADFFFTSCPTICPVMKKQMLRVYNEFKDNPEVVLLSHTIDPEHDTPAVLKKYAEDLGVKGNQWQFLTGKKEDIYKIAESYLIPPQGLPQEDSTAAGGFIHDGSFILIDKQKRVRGTNRPYEVIDENGIKTLNYRYDGTKGKGVDLLIEDIKILLKEGKSVGQ
ncbi:MAG: SCO family protein [Runella sp.]